MSVLEISDRKRDVAGLVLHDISREELVLIWERAREHRQTIVLYGYSLTVLPKFREYPEIATISNTFELMISDGRGLFWLANLVGEPIRDHFSLPDAVALVLEHASEQKLRVFLLGATCQVNDAAVRNLTTQGIQVEGRDGYFAMHDLPAITAQLEDCQPDLVLIGITSPKKEQIASYLRTRLRNCLIIPCGGMIDVLAGVTHREPRFVQKLGLTWLFRWVQEPRRLLRPVLYNGMYSLLWLAPMVIARRRIFRDRDFSIADYWR
jgi:N-acetylglucosaminyldiphosphoundecaprenol N-acetyl-beta-D-mannosaminyltransferase